MSRLQGLRPVVSPATRVLVLGSFPGVRSLQLQQYYAHPQNHFWPLLEAIWPASPHADCVDRYEIRSKWLLARGLGLWDVYAECEREGSLDANIRDPRVNDLAALVRRLPKLQAIAHNGGESARSMRITGALGFKFAGYAFTLPIAFLLAVMALVPAMDDMQQRH